MKHKLFFGIALLSALLWMGCPPEELAADYALKLPTTMDSVEVQWVFSGTSERESRLFQQSDNTWPEFLYFAANVNPDTDNPDVMLPSMVFDSIFVYWTALGETNLVYSGVQDADWEHDMFGEDQHRYTLTF